MKKVLFSVLCALPLIVLVQTKNSSAQSEAGINSSAFSQSSAAQIQQESAKLLVEARGNPTGLADVTFEKYPRSNTMMAVRTSSGGAELHQHVADFFVVLQGEATEVVGGRIEGGKTTAPGEIRGTRVVGGTRHLLHKGDIIHIAANTPHQAILAPGTVFVYYVIKVQQ